MGIITLSPDWTGETADEVRQRMGGSSFDRVENPGTISYPWSGIPTLLDMVIFLLEGGRDKPHNSKFKGMFTKSKS